MISAVLLVIIGVAGVSARTDASEARFRAAFQDISRVSGQVVSTKAQAKSLCNQEKHLADCAEIGKRHSLYTAERAKQVDAVLEEFKGKAVEDLKKCQSAECLVSVANDVASRLSKSAPEIAKKLDLTPSKIEEKKTIVEAAKEIGVDPIACRDMDPDTAQLDTLRACARLAKHERVRAILPEEAQRAVEFSDASTRLDESLKRKEYQCGDNTAEGCGNFCLNSAGPARSGGESAIPPICRTIAERFFGAEGVRHLEAAHTGVRQTAEAHARRAENVVFTTLEGKTLTNPVEIGRYLEDQGKKGNVEAVEKGLDFMIARGFAASEDKEFALGMVRKAKEKGGLPDFEACRQNVSLCQDFIPEEHRAEFKGFQEFESVMRQELGFDPGECRRGELDESIGTRCLEASKRALPRIEALTERFPQIGHISADIRRRVAESEERIARKDQFGEEFKQHGGPGGCQSEEACRQYCSNPTNGPECIAWGAKNQIAGFRGEEAIERFQEFHQAIQQPEGGRTESLPREFRGEGPFPGFEPPGRGGVPPGETSGFTAPGRGFEPPPGAAGGRGGFGGPGGIGPSPQCFAAIEQGDFAKAKELCEVRFSGPVPPPPERPACPFVRAEACQEGQYRRESRDANLCPFFGECVSIPGYRPQAKRICPAMPTVDECPADQERVAVMTSPDCGAYYRCVPKGIGSGGGSDGSGGAGGRGGYPQDEHRPPMGEPSKPICPKMPTVENCPAGERKVPSFSSPGCGAYYRCEREPAFSQPPPYESPYPRMMSPAPYHTPYPGPSPHPSGDSSESPRSAYSPQPTYYPSPTYSSQPTYTPAPTHSAVPTSSYTPQPTYAPEPTHSSAPTHAPSPSESPVSPVSLKRGFFANIGAALNATADLFGRWFAR